MSIQFNNLFYKSYLVLSPSQNTWPDSNFIPKYLTLSFFSMHLSLLLIYLFSFQNTSLPLSLYLSSCFLCTKHLSLIPVSKTKTFCILGWREYKIEITIIRVIFDWHPVLPLNSMLSLNQSWDCLNISILHFNDSIYIYIQYFTHKLACDPFSKCYVGYVLFFNGKRQRELK